MGSIFNNSRYVIPNKCTLNMRLDVDVIETRKHNSGYPFEHGKEDEKSEKHCHLLNGERLLYLYRFSRLKFDISIYRAISMAHWK